MLKLTLSSCPIDTRNAVPGVYIKSLKRKNGKMDFVIIALYIDDIIWFSNNTKMLEDEKLALAKRLLKLKTLETYTMFSVCLPNKIEDQEHFRLLRRNTLKESLNELTRETASQYQLGQGRKFEPLREDEEPVDAHVDACRHIKWQLDV